jgi:hypothetical protein
MFWHRSLAPGICADLSSPHPQPFSPVIPAARDVAIWLLQAGFTFISMSRIRGVLLF